MFCRARFSAGLPPCTLHSTGRVGVQAQQARHYCGMPVMGAGPGRVSAWQCRHSAHSGRTTGLDRLRLHHYHACFAAEQGSCETAECGVHSSRTASMAHLKRGMRPVMAANRLVIAATTLSIRTLRW